MNKNGQSIIQPIIIVVILMVFAVTSIVMVFVWSSIGGALEDSTLNDDPDQANAISKLKNFGSTYVGGIFMFVFIGLALGLIITSFLVPEHPIFIIAYIIMLIISIFLTAIIANVWGAITDVGPFASIAQDQTLINMMMRNIVKIEIALFFITMLIIFGKPFLSTGTESSGGRM